MKLKPVIIELIEKGYHNQRIAKAVGASINYVVTLRADYNAASPVVYRSRIAEPKIGTKSRIVYDFILANPDCSFTDTVKRTGMDQGLVGSIRRRLLSVKKYREMLPQKQAMFDVDLSELKL